MPKIPQKNPLQFGALLAHRYWFASDERFIDSGPGALRKYWVSFEKRWASYWFNQENEVARKELAKRDGADWAFVVERVKDPDVRAHCACLIWWDWFGQRNCLERWAHLDFYVKRRFVRVSTTDTIAGLVVCGYTLDMAITRMKMAEEEYEEEDKEVVEALA